MLGIAHGGVAIGRCLYMGQSEGGRCSRLGLGLELCLVVLLLRYRCIGGGLGLRRLVVFQFAHARLRCHKCDLGIEDMLVLLLFRRWSRAR